MTKLTVGCITQLTDGGVSQTIYDRGHASRMELRDIAARHLDEAIKAKLIELGWTPPGVTRTPLPNAEFVALIDKAGFTTWDSRMWALKRGIEEAHGIKETP